MSGCVNKWMHRSVSRGVWGGGPLSGCGWCVYQEPFKGCDWRETSRPSAFLTSEREITSASREIINARRTSTFESCLLKADFCICQDALLHLMDAEAAGADSLFLSVCVTGWNDVPRYFVRDIIQHHAHRIISGAATWHVSVVSTVLICTLTIRFFWIIRWMKGLCLRALK